MQFCIFFKKENNTEEALLYYFPWPLIMGKPKRLESQGGGELLPIQYTSREVVSLYIHRRKNQTNAF
jgi:hypothetical protein